MQMDNQYIAKGKFVGLFSTEEPWFSVLDLEKQTDRTANEKTSKNQKNNIINAEGFTPKIKLKSNTKSDSKYDIIGGALLLGVVALILFNLISGRKSNH